MSVEIAFWVFGPEDGGNMFHWNVVIHHRDHWSQRFVFLQDVRIHLQDYGLS